MVEELKLAIKIDDASIEQSLLKQFANAQKMADKVVLDFKNVNFDDKQIEAKFKEMQKKAGQNPIDFSISGNTLDMLGQIDKRLTEIFSIGKGKSFIDSSSTVADIGKIENKINELNKKYEEAQKKLSSIGSGGISGKDVNLVDNKEFQKLSYNFEKIKGEIDELKQKINTIDIDTEWLNNFTTGLDEELTDTQAKLDNFINDFNSSFEKINTSTSNTFFNEESIRIFEKLLTSIESSLSSIKGILVDVGDGEELSPLLREINNIQTAIGGLSSSLNNLHFNMNIDMGTDNQMDAKIQEKAAKALNAYEKLFNGLKMSGYGGEVVNNKFFDFDINKFDTTIGKVKAYKDIIERLRKEAKEYYGGTDLLRTQTDDKLWRSASSAGGQLTQAINETVKNKTDNPLTELFGKTDLSGVIEQLNTIVSKLDEISVSAKGFTETFKNGLNVNASVEEIEKLTNRVKELESELAKIKTPTAVTSEPTKDAFLSTEATASVEKIADGFKEVKQNTEQATEVTEKYQRVLSQVGELGVDAKVSAMYQRNDGQLESVSWKAKRDDQGQILYDKNGNIDYDFNSTVISKYEQLEKIITTADNKLRDLQKSLKDTQNLNSNASTKNIEEQIQYQKDYIQLLEQTVKAISQQDEYLLYEQQIIDARAKAEKEYNLNQGTKSDISNAKQLASDEQKRQKSIEQTNRLLNKQQIIIDGIEKSYSKAANNDLDKAVNSQSDLAELANKKAEIQKLINQLTNQDRNSLNEKDFLLLEKYIAEYKQLAKDKLKANNPSKQELGGQQLDVLLSQQVAQYNQLITKAEKYGEATADIVQKLKDQRDAIAEINSDGIYTAKSGLKADDYYSARDNYKIGKAQFSSYETDIKNTEKLIQAQKELGEATTKARQSAKDATQSSVDNALKDQVAAWKNIQFIREKIAKTKDTNEIANLQQVKKEYQQNYIEADRILKSNSSLYDKEIQLAKLEQIRVETNKKIADYQDKQISGYDNRLESYTKKTSGYDATIARFNDGGWTSDAYLKNVQAVKDAVKQYEDLLNKLKGKDASLVTSDDISKLDEYEKKIKDTIVTITNMSAAEKGYSQLAGQKEIDKINKILRENSAMSSEAKAKIKAYKQELISGNPSVSLEKIHGEIMKIVNAEELAGRAGRSMFDVIKEKAFYGFAAQIGMYFGFNDIVRYAQQAISTIVDLDDALLDLKKTTSMSSTELNNFYYSANDVAKQMGVTTKSIIEQASAWSRLGYSSNEQATEMAKLSSKFASISPGMDTDQAQEGMVSIMKAWQINPEDVEKEILDPINQLGNKFAESNDDIVEGMKRSAAALAAVGTDYKDAYSLFTGVQEVLQNSEVAGRALRSISMRIRGYDENSEDGFEQTDDELKNITGDLIDLTKTAQHAQGVSIFKEGSTTEFKSLVDYFGEIHDIWNEMSQKQQNDFLQKAFGKTQAQSGAALIQNYDAVKEALAEIDKSAGSADKEMSTVEQTLSYKINALKETWVGCAQQILDRGDLGIAISGLNGVSKVITGLIDNVGLLKTAAMGVAAALSFKNVGILELN